MIHRFRYKLLVLLLLSIVAASVNGQVLDGSKDFFSARSAALGGPHAALTDDYSSLFNNPAGFAGLERQLSFGELSVWISGPVFTFADIITNSDILVAIQEEPQTFSNLKAKMSMLGPLSFGFVENGLGFGLFSKMDIDLQTRGLIKPVTIDISQTVTMAGGPAFRLPFFTETGHTLDIGFLMKGSVAGIVAMERDLVEIPALVGNIGPDTLLAHPFSLKTSVGIDAGIRYAWNETIIAGVTAKDLYRPALIQPYSSLQGFLDSDSSAVESTIYPELPPINLSAGLLFQPTFPALELYVTNIKFMLDYQDILDFVIHPATSANPLLHVGTGIELTLLEILSLRGGFYQGLFSAGLGMDLTYGRVNLTMFGRELSNEPGLYPVYNVLVSVEFRM